MLVLGVRKAYDDQFREGRLQWCFGLSLVVVMSFMVNAMILFLRFHRITMDR